MFIGVFLYSFAIGSLSSLLSRLDIKNYKFNHLMQILNRLKKEYNINQTLILKIKNHFKYGKD